MLKAIRQVMCYDVNRERSFVVIFAVCSYQQWRLREEAQEKKVGRAFIKYSFRA